MASCNGRWHLHAAIPGDHCRNNQRQTPVWLSGPFAPPSRASDYGRLAVSVPHRATPPLCKTEATAVWTGCRLVHSSPERSEQFIETSRVEGANAAAWLGAAACMVLCEQEGVAKGRVLLNMQVERSSLEHIGGFGFSAGSLLMPVKINSSCALPALARHIHDRTSLMIDRGWNDNFERFLGSSPRRHRLLAALHARGQPTPIVSVSWKGRHWQLGGQDGLRDIACFAVSPTIHISGHVDRIGMSLSVTSRQSVSEREDFLHRLADRFDGDTPKRILHFNGCDVDSALD